LPRGSWGFCRGYLAEGCQNNRIKEIFFLIPWRTLKNRDMLLELPKSGMGNDAWNRIESISYELICLINKFSTA
jgi:hypothetical protein